MQFLDPVDRKLLELTVGGRVTRREAAMLLGRNPGAVTRRMWALLRRLNDPLVAALAEDGKLLPELHQEVGLAYFLRREPISRIARAYGLTPHGVKRMIADVRGWHWARKGERAKG
jgi:hypothetical protein